MRIRNGAALLLAAGLALTTAGCGFMVPLATSQHFDPSDGITVKVGEITLGNMIAFSDNNGDSNIVFGAVNDTGRAQTVNLQFTSESGQKVTVPVRIEAGYGPYGTEANDQIIAKGGGGAGTLQEIYVQYGDELGVQTHIPVLNANEWDIYKGLNPKS
ncbi:MAG: hypothetical protein WBA28_02965 [Microbacteriaceae bacterium]